MKYFFLIAAVFLTVVSCEDDRNERILTNNSSLSYIEGYDNMINYRDPSQQNTPVENPFVNTNGNSQSLFSIDADGAAYTNVRRFLANGELPPKSAIRIEEMINYFSYDYDEPINNENISLSTELTECPWQEGHHLLRLGIKGKEIAENNLPQMNLVLLVDISGSMAMNDRLDLLKESLLLLLDNLRPNDRLAIVTYSNTVNVVLESIDCTSKENARQAIENLEADGITAGADGILKAYEIAAQNFIYNGMNRVIVTTDGDFNVGPSTQTEMIDVIKRKRDSGIFLTILGMGTNSLNDDLMEKISNYGNGNYEYIDNIDQAEKVFKHEFNKFFPVATDVNVHVSFNDINVEAYRLIGYENRLLYNGKNISDTKDAGEIGAGQTVTVLYELVLKNNGNKPIASIALDYNAPNQNTSKNFKQDVFEHIVPFEQATQNTKFAAAVAQFSLQLCNSVYQGNSNISDIESWMENSMQYDPNGYRKSFLKMVTSINKNI